MAVKNVKKTAKSKKGGKFSCSVCGLAISVDNTCGCVDACDIICCGQEMEQKKKKR